MNKKHMYPPNILITNFCNQDCSFCFAAEEMGNKTIKKEMSLKDFKTILLKMKKNPKIKVVKLLGGEPTLHSQFKEILKYALKHFIYVRIYTNGIFSKKIRDVIASNPARIILVVNISTPGFFLNKKTRTLILKNIDYLSGKTPTILSVVSFFMDQSVINNFKNIPKSIIRKTAVKLSLMAPMVNDNNFISINDFPEIGANLREIIQKLEKIGPPLQFRFNKIFRPCMFSPKEIAFLKRRRLDFVTKNTTCHNDQKNGDLFHIASDLSTFKCYPLSTVDISSVKTESLPNLRKKYQKKQINYKKELILPECRKCPFFGFEEGMCSGPCIAFRINALKENAQSEQKTALKKKVPKRNQRIEHVSNNYPER